MSWVFARRWLRGEQEFSVVNEPHRQVDGLDIFG
jgi:hypothetical protein